MSDFNATSITETRASSIVLSDASFLGFFNISSTAQHYVVPQINATGGELPQRTIEHTAETLAGQLARTPPSKRFALLLRKDPIGAASIVAGAAGSLYALSMCAAILAPAVFHFLSFSAYAAPTAVRAANYPIVYGIVSSRDPYDWMVTAFMGIILFISVIATFFIEDEKKVASSQDLTKIITGSILGFLGGGGGRPAA